VTLGAVLGRRLVLVLQFELGLSVKVAEKTEIGSTHLQKAGEISGVRIVADIAVSGRHRSMDDLLRRFVVLVTGETKLAGCFLDQLFLRI
jgi:hypothetical protein